MLSQHGQSHSTEKHFTALNPILYIADLTFEIRARAVHHIIMERTSELPLEQKLNLHQVGDPIKRHTDLFKYGYIPYV